MADKDTGRSKDESNSIVNQRSLIHHFLDNHAELSKSIRKEFVDDGFTGTNTARPAFQDMIRQIRNGSFNICITKDFSRFSRDYIEIGDYLECLFPFLRVRYISINDGYDSKKYIGTTGGLEMVMRNIVYAAYSKDISAKEIAGNRQSMKKGRRTGGHPGYGYMPDPNRKSMDIIDPEASKVVRKIFELAIRGTKVGKIAKILNEENIPTPSVYFQMKHPELKKYRNLPETKRWDYPAVRNILNRYAYTGASVGHLRSKIIPCGKNTVKVKKEDQIIVPGMHEAIVTEKEYEAAQKVVKKVKYTKMTEHKYPLKSLIFCGNCGRRMERCIPQFKCIYGRHDKDSLCNEIRSPLEDELNKIIFEAIQNVIRLTDCRWGRSKTSQAKNKAVVEAGIEETAILSAKIDVLKKEKLKAYEKYYTEKWDKNVYICEKRKLDEEIAECEKGIQKNEEARELNGFSSESGLETAVSTYRGEKHLVFGMAQAFIEKIIIYQEEKIEIQWLFKECFLNDGSE